MDRPSWNEIFIDICQTIAKRATCAKLQTAAIIVKDTRIISMGYNGTPKNSQHCIEYWRNFQQVNAMNMTFLEYLETEDFKQNHHEWALLNELHAECNCILAASKIGISLNETTLITLYSPCIFCAKEIICVGIVKVIYKIKYNDDGINFLKKNNINCIQYIDLGATSDSFADMSEYPLELDNQSHCNE